MNELTAIANNQLSLAEVKSQVLAIQTLMKDLMQEGEHYGVIPGCGSKPSLLKAGAEKLSLMFRMRPEFDIKIVDFPNGQREYQVKCTLFNIQNNYAIGEGVGSCSTLESKYRFRNASRKCPECGKESIIKGKPEYGGGWVCFKAKGGCGSKWTDTDPIIVDQECGRIDNPDIADMYNTCLKMGKKRAHVDAILTATAASDIFTQDIEDFAHEAPTPPVKQTTPAGEEKPASEENPTEPQAQVILDIQAPVQQELPKWQDAKPKISEKPAAWAKMTKTAQQGFNKQFNTKFEVKEN